MRNNKLVSQTSGVVVHSFLQTSILDFVHCALIQFIYCEKTCKLQRKACHKWGEKTCKLKKQIKEKKHDISGVTHTK